MFAAFLAGLYLQGGVGYMLPHPPPGDHGYQYYLYDLNLIKNPYGTVEVGWETTLDRFAFGFDFHHESSIPVNDYGQNIVEIHLRWHPWAGE